MADSPESEQHPQLPSGYWTGFYVYSHNANRHEMLIMLEFANGIITGNGSDDVSAFTFRGSYNLDTMTCQFLKNYATHAIDYQGHIDENGIWGKWYYVHDNRMGFSIEVFNAIVKTLGDQASGGFHIWPSAKEFSAHEMEVRKLKEEEVVKFVQ